MSIIAREPKMETEPAAMRAWVENRTVYLDITVPGVVAGHFQLPHPSDPVAG
jgi:hypothetical protein